MHRTNWMRASVVIATHFMNSEPFIADPFWGRLGWMASCAAVARWVGARSYVRFSQERSKSNVLIAMTSLAHSQNNCRNKFVKNRDLVIGCLVFALIQREHSNLLWHIWMRVCRALWLWKRCGIIIHKLIKKPYFLFSFHSFHKWINGERSEKKTRFAVDSHHIFSYCVTNSPVTRLNRSKTKTQNLYSFRTIERNSEKSLSTHFITNKRWRFAETCTIFVSFCLSVSGPHFFLAL